MTPDPASALADLSPPHAFARAAERMPPPTDRGSR